MCDPLKKKVKRSFSDTWLNDDRLKSWIRKVPSDDTLFHCVMCNKTFSCNSYILRHANSTSHKNSITENASNHVNNENLQKKKKRYEKKFRQQWLDLKQFKSWLREAPNDANAFFCLICNRSVVGGLSHIHRHAQSKGHIDKSNEKEKKENIGTNENIKSNEDINTNESLLSFDVRKKTAEIRYAALIAEYNIPPHTATDVLQFLQHIGNDSKVLKNMRMKRTKCKNIIANVLYPIEIERIVNSLQNTKFSIFINNISDICNDVWITFLVRYICPETLEVRSQLVKLINIDTNECNAEELFSAFQSEMYKLQIPFLNIRTLACDNTSVMTGEHLSFKTKLQKKCKNLLTFTCPCYSVALAVHAACSKLPTFCEEFLMNLGNFINTSSNHSAAFNEFSICFQHIVIRKIFKLHDARWFYYYSCIEKVLESWDSIKYNLNEINVNKKSYSVESLLSLMEKTNIKGYYLFLKYVLNLFNQFNAFFQATETRIHLLQSKSINLLINISQHFLKSEVLKHLLSNITFFEKENHKCLNEINLGSECEEYLQNLEKEGHEDLSITIRQNCLKFYIVVAKEIRKHLPVYDVFLQKLQVFQPYTSLLDFDRETSFNDISFIINSLGDFDEDKLKEEWSALYSDLSIEEKQKLLQLDFDNMWKEICKYQSNNVIKYPNIRLLLDAIRSLPNSNADSERAFSLLFDVKTIKRNRLSPKCINAICVFKSALKARQETALEMKISEQHLSLMSANNLYRKSPERQKNNADINNIVSPSSSFKL